MILPAPMHYGLLIEVAKQRKRFARIEDSYVETIDDRHKLRR